MASPSAILRAARAVPAGGRPTPAPQGSANGLYPYIGQIRQDSTQPGYGYSQPYGTPFLPRLPEDFTAGAFTPMSPILPVPIDQPATGFARPTPRRWQPYPGYNLPIGTPGTEGYKLASFATLKALGENYSIMRTCLERRKNEIRSLDWDIVLTPEAAKAYQGDREAMRDFGERKARVKKFFRKPDPDFFDFSSWLYALMDQVFVLDALSVYLMPKKGTGLGRGLLGSDLDCLQLIDGSSIRPLRNLKGGMPAPPAPAYQQYEFGVPRVDLAAMVDDRDLDGAGAGELKAQLRGDQFFYHPYLPRVDSPYGFSLVEQAIIPIMTGLRKQAYQLSFFDESTVPRCFITAGKDMTPNQIREFQDAINAIAGDLAWAFKVLVIPAESKVVPQKQMEIVDQADEWIATEVAMVADINPMELGIIPRVSVTASPFAAREMAQASRTIHQRTSTKPTLKYLTSIPDVILQVVCGQDDMRFIFNGMEEEQDIAAMTDVGVKQAQSAISSIDEVREDLGKPPWGLPETSGPVVFTAAGPLPLGQGMDTVSDDIASVKPLTDAHAAAQAHAAITGDRPPSRATPRGISGQGRMNGPVTQRQARRGGALAPAHSTAEGSPGHSGASPPRRKAAAAVPAAVSAELEALARHLRKGRAISTWQPVHIPGHALAVISEDLAKGLSPDQAVEIAKTIVLGSGDYEWLSKTAPAGGQSPKAASPSGPQSQRQQAAQQLAQAYAARIQQAFATATGQAAKLIAQWAAGTLTVTLAALVVMIADLVRKALARALRGLWRKAWALGVSAAQDEAGGQWTRAASDEALRAFLASWGEDLAGLISATRMRQIQEELTTAIREGRDPQDVARVLESILRVDSRAEMIARTEVKRALNEAILAALKALGVAYKVWVTSGLPGTCATCIANQKAGPIPLSGLFPGQVAAAPQHPNCRCEVRGWQPPGPGSSKSLRRQADLNGEVTWAEAEDEPDPAGLGGRGPVRHLADGTQIPDNLPGTPGPRWDASEPYPSDRGINGGDDASQGGERGTGTQAFPAGYMDGYAGGPVPQPGHGTQQAPMSSPGAATGRPPNAVGKAANAADFLRNAPKAKASAVLAQLEANYPPASIAWVKRAKWHGPAEVPLPLIDWAGRKRWAADKETSRVDEFARRLTAGERVNPVVMVAEPGHGHYRIIDGHHRGLACRKLGWPVRAWVAEVAGDDLKAALETHSSQWHQGADPANKSFTAGNRGVPGATYGLTGGRVNTGGDSAAAGNRVASRPGESCPREPHVAGLMVRAADTGRVLMLQRALDDDQDHAAGKWEPPGGHAEPGETLLQAALREFAEETGHPVPQGSLTGSWTSGDGVYAGFVLTVPSEDVIDLEHGRDQVANPDGDAFEAAAFWDPADFGDNPAVRPEMARDLPQVLAALDGAMKSAKGQGSAEVLREYWRGEAHPGPTQFALERKIRWGEPGDWYRCHDELTPYLGAEGAKGYCNLRHKEVLGYYPSQHAQMERGK